MIPAAGPARGGSYVVATAGHVDHGKSTLVRALTGVEPDRWAEERRRGMTIDLGFAWTTLPSGASVAFVDVPGHQRFIANMLAGMGPAPAVLFVVAADEGWARQSAEHLAIISALQVRHAVLAVTRSDLADPGPALADAAGRLAAAGVADMSAVAVSGRTGAGLAQLRAALDAMTSRLPAPDPNADVRFWIDRAFSIRGSGTVVTGTLATGTIAVGDELELRDRRVSVRSLQSRGESATSIAGAARVALNLRGVAVHEVGRGDALLSPKRWRRTTEVDVRVDADDQTQTPIPTQCVLHVGAAAVAVRLRPLGGKVVRLQLQTPLPLRAGDRAVLRDPGAQSVAGAVLVLDAEPPPLRRRGAAAGRASALGGDDPAVPTPQLELARRGAVSADLLRRLGIDAPDGADVVRHGEWLVAAEQWRQWCDATPAVVEQWAHTHPLTPDMPLIAVARALALPDPALISPLLAAAGLGTQDGAVVQPRTTLGPVEHAVAQLERRLSARPFAAPERDELAALRMGRRELAAAVRAGRLLSLPGDVVLLPDALALAAKRLAELPQPFTASEARAALGTSRRVAIPLLEHLDSLLVTERVDGARRRLTGPALSL